MLLAKVQTLETFLQLCIKLKCFYSIQPPSSPLLEKCLSKFFLSHPLPTITSFLASFPSFRHYLLNWSSFGTFFLNHRFLYNCSNKPNKHASFISFRSTFPNNFISAIYIWRWISQRSSFEDEYLDLFSLIFHTGAVTNKNIVRQLGFFSELICRIKLILFPLGFYFFPGRFWHP